MSRMAWASRACLGVAVAVWTLAAQAWAEDIANGSFEAFGEDGLPSEWASCVIGDMPAVARDTEVVKDGAASLRMSAAAPVDAALQQHVKVRPGRYYTLIGWVRTKDLVAPPSSHVHGTLAVMTPGGAGEGSLIVQGERLPGTRDWTRVRVPFEGPAGGQVRILCFLCGWGRGTGTVWFDGLHIVEEENVSMRVVVTPKELSAKPISPLVCGNFIESGFGRQVDRMWAEMLQNRSFEDVTPLKGPVWGWLNRKPEDDLSKEDWWHSGYEEHEWYAAPKKPGIRMGHPAYWNFHHGLQAGELINPTEDTRAYLAQDGLYLRRGVTYLFKGAFQSGERALKGGPTVEATIGLYPEGVFDKPIIEKKLAGIGSSWEEASVEFANPDFEGPATFAISSAPGVNVTVDGFSLMPADHVEGWRKGTIEALRHVNPRIVRFPGGCYASFYNWRDGVGPMSERRPRESEYWGGLESNDVGTAEFVTLCRKIGAEPFLCANVMTGTPAEAADWVAYCNADATHPAGALRKEHGYAEPFDVHYWELDNETYRKFGAIEYAERCVTFAKAMKAVDPDIQLVMVGYWRFRDSLPEMLEIAGKYIDVVTDRGGDEAYLRGVLADIGAYNAKSGRSILLCNTEWLAPTGDVPFIPDALNRQPVDSEMTLQNQQIRWRYAMNAAKQVLTFQRLGGDFLFSNFNNMANTWGQNVIECSKEKVWVSAAGRVFELLSRSEAAWPLEIEVPEERPGILVQAAFDLHHHHLILDVLNHRGQAIEANFDLTPAGYRASRAAITTLSAPSPAAFNSAEHPDTVTREETEHRLERATRFSLNVPAHAIMHIVLR